jgi:hypothetical protein
MVSVFSGFSKGLYCIVVGSNRSPTGAAGGLMLLDQFLADPIYGIFCRDIFILVGFFIFFCFFSVFISFIYFHCFSIILIDVNNFLYLCFWNAFLGFRYPKVACICSRLRFSNTFSCNVDDV